MIRFKQLFCLLCAVLLLSAFTMDRPRKFTVFLIGDSTMADKSLKGNNPERGWGMMLQGFFTENVTVDNHAVNGRSTKSFIDEGRWKAVLQKIQKGDYVFIEFGHNDEKLKEKLHTVPGTTFDDNLRRFVRETREKGGIPVLFNSIVRRNFPPEGKTFSNAAEARDFLSASGGHYEHEGNVLVDTHGSYLESPRKVAAEMNVPFVDLNSLTRELVVKYGREGSKRLWQHIPAGVYDACLNGRTDNTHLSVYGARAVASIAIDAVARQIPEIARYVRHYDYVVSPAGRGDFFTLDEAVKEIQNPDKKKQLSVLVLPGTYDVSKGVLKEAKNKRISFVKQQGTKIVNNGY